MVAERIIETNEGIQDSLEVEQYDVMARYLRDKGYIETDAIIKSGINSGHALEMGPGPGYLGLEWLSKTAETRLTALEISDAMIRMSKKNADEYGLADRISYVKGTGLDMPLKDSQFDGVFSNGSLHEWEDPTRVFDEMYRVLKSGGRMFVSDLRRDMSGLIRWFLKSSCKPRSMRRGLVSSINAAYTQGEIEGILGKSKFTDFRVTSSPFGLQISGIKR